MLCKPIVNMVHFYGQCDLLISSVRLTLHYQCSLFMLKVIIYLINVIYFCCQRDLFTLSKWLTIFDGLQCVISIANSMISGKEEETCERICKLKHRSYGNQLEIFINFLYYYVLPSLGRTTKIVLKKIFSIQRI